jgi:hypothetical protein
VEKIFSIKKHPLVYTTISIVALSLLVFSVSRSSFDIRRKAYRPTVSEVDLDISEAVIIYCRGESMLIDPTDLLAERVMFTCLGDLTDDGDPDIRETGADRFIIMNPEDLVNLNCSGRFEHFEIKESTGYQIFCN